MGGTKTKTTSNQQQNQTVELPAWLTHAAQQTYGQAKAFSDANPVQGYGRQMVAATSANQQHAGAAAAAGVTTGQADLAAARAATARAGAGTTPQVTAAGWTPGAAEAYRSPYVDQVQQRTMATMDRQNQVAHQQLNDSALAAHAYGGTRHAVLEAAQGRDQANSMLDFLAASNADAYSSGQAQFNQDRAAGMQAQVANSGYAAGDLDRQLAAAAASNQTASSATGTATDNIMNLLRTGGVDQDAENARLGGDYSEFLRMQDAGVDRYSALMAMLTGAPRNVTTSGTSSGTSTTKQSGGLMNSLLSAGLMGASIYSGNPAAFSDPRLKKDATLIERLANGLGIWRFHYLWERADEPEHIGCMADEVARIVPEALGPVIGGYLTVRYDMLREAF